MSQRQAQYMIAEVLEVPHTMVIFAESMATEPISILFPIPCSSQRDASLVPRWGLV